MSCFKNIASKTKTVVAAFLVATWTINMFMSLMTLSVPSGDVMDSILNPYGHRIAYISAPWIHQEEGGERPFNVYKQKGSRVPQGLWIYVHSWAEGISSWRYSLAKIILLADELNATLVEPDILHGKLVAPGHGNLRLFDLYDYDQMALLQERAHTRWASAEQYQQAIEDATGSMLYFDWCLTKSTVPESCSSFGGRYDEEERRISSNVTRAFQAAEQSTSSSSMVVLRLESVWKNELNDLRLAWVPERRLFDVERVEHIVQVGLDFHPYYYQLASESLAAMGIRRYSDGRHFGVVHWRAELPDIQYLTCAKLIVKARAAMLAEFSSNQNGPEKPPLPFILMSSLSTDESIMWAGARRQAQNSTAAAALNRLTHEYDFAMIDAVLPSLLPHTTTSSTTLSDKPPAVVPDMIVQVVVDLILARQATLFSTCTVHCPERVTRTSISLCRQCNHAGRFADFALELRAGTAAAAATTTISGRNQSSGKTTWPCWPRGSR
jgi:hypothetical protein